MRNKTLIKFLFAMALLALMFALIFRKKSETVELPTGVFILGVDTVKINNGIILK